MEAIMIQQTGTFVGNKADYKLNLRIPPDKLIDNANEKAENFQILRLKNEDLPAGCVCKIPCSNCRLSYVGQTNNLKRRIAENRSAAIKNSDMSSAIVSHINDNGHEINFDGVEVLAISDVRRDRVTMEAIMIQQTGTLVGNKADYKLNLRIPPDKLIDNAENFQIVRPKNEDLPAGCVYKIPCSNCSLSYVGQTNNLKRRIAENRSAAIKNSDMSSAIVSHINDNGHEINFDGVEDLARRDVRRDKVTMEAIMIQQTDTFVSNKADYKLNLRIPPDKLIDNANEKAENFQILRPKNEDLPAGCVYKIPCSNCSLLYVGQTNNLKRWIAAHRRAAIKKSDVSSAIVSHVNDNGNEINLDGVEVLARSDVRRDRVTMEAIMIQQTDTFVGNKADYKLRSTNPTG
ncbi:hypothetical protein ACOME3_005626 [Neoechinorhynchus agilis]